MIGTRYKLEDIGGLQSSEVFQLYGKYVNSGFVSLIGNMGYGRVYQAAYDCNLEDEQGETYLDFMGGYGSLNLGHNHPAVVKSLEAVRRAPNVLHNTLNPYTAVLAAKLAELTGGSLTRSFFCNSGSEAVEGAVKLARAATGRPGIVYCANAYHGKSIGALSVSGRDHYKTPFGPLLSHCQEVPFGDAAALEKELQTGQAAAFIVEPVQGEGGVILPPEGYLKQAEELCAKYGTLLIMDEVQTGMGRTGRMLAYEYEGLVPDIVCLAKSLGGGIMPIGAYIAKDSVYQAAYGSIENCLLHTSTFGGNTYACAAAIAAIDTLLDEELPRQAEEKGRYMLERLNRLKDRFKFVKDVRGKGLLLGIEFHRASPSGEGAAAPVDSLQSLIEGNYALQVTVRLLHEWKILIGYSLGNADLIRIEPPLTVSYTQIDHFTGALGALLEQLEEHGGSRE